MQSQCTKELPMARVINQSTVKVFSGQQDVGNRSRAANPERNLRAPVEIQITELTRIANESKRNTLCVLGAQLYRLSSGTRASVLECPPEGQSNSVVLFSSLLPLSNQAVQ